MADNFNTPKTEESTVVWITPKYIIEALAPFDLDPCANERMPWPTAARMHTLSDGDGLALPWHHSRVWLNPPYGDGMWPWLEKLAAHKKGIALLFARSDTKGYQREVLAKSHSIFYFEGRVRFFNEWGKYPLSKKTGKPMTPNAPSVLVSYSEEDTISIHRAWIFGDLPGTLVRTQKL